MKCIFCLEDRPGTEEHVFADAIGGTLFIDRVCADCNSDAGSKIDAPLLDHVLVLMRRLQLGLVPRSGKTPNPFPVGTLAGDPSQTVYVKYGAPSEAPEIAFRDNKTVTVEGSTSNTRYVLEDPSPKKVATIINRHRRREGLPELAGDALDAEIAKTVSRQTVVNPTIHHQVLIDLFRFGPALLKVAYELAWRWLGDAYLEDPVAKTIRDRLAQCHSTEQEGLPSDIGFTWTVAAGRPFLEPWKDEANRHIGLLRVEGPAIWVFVRVFDVLGGAFRVSKSPGVYPAVENRFLGIDPGSGATRDHSLEDEVRYMIRSAADGENDGTAI